MGGILLYFTTKFNTKTTRKLIDLLRMMMIYQSTCLNRKIYMKTSMDRAKNEKKWERKESASMGRGRGGGEEEMRRAEHDGGSSQEEGRKRGEEEMRRR